MLMGLIIASSSVLLIINVKGFLMGKKASAETEKEIREVILSFTEVHSIPEFKTMHLGSEKILLQFDIAVAASLSAGKSAELITRMKKEIKKAVPLVETIQIEVQVK